MVTAESPTASIDALGPGSASTPCMAAMVDTPRSCARRRSSPYATPSLKVKRRRGLCVKLSSTALNTVALGSRSSLPSSVIITVLRVDSDTTRPSYESTRT